MRGKRGGWKKNPCILLKKGKKSKREIISSAPDHTSEASLEGYGAKISIIIIIEVDKCVWCIKQ